MKMKHWILINDIRIKKCKLEFAKNFYLDAYLFELWIMMFQLIDEEKINMDVKIAQFLPDIDQIK